MEQFLDTINGLPVHPLVVHAVVVLGPLTALLAVVYAAVPRWRLGLRWPLVAMAVVAAVSAVAAEGSGEALEERLESFDGVTQAVETHVEAGELAKFAMLGLLVAVLVIVFVLARVNSTATSGSTAALVLAVAALGFVGFATYAAGHSGAEAVWSDLISTTNGGD